MFSSLHVMHFRNIRELSLQFHPRCNLFFGENGQGKTNILEALYLLATLRSFRTHRLDELISSDVQSFSAAAQIQTEGTSHALSVHVSRGRPVQKRVELDLKSSKPMDYLGHIHAIVFVPEDVSLPMGAPSVRRKFLDRAVWNIYPSYLQEAQLYERLLKQRNAALRTQSTDVLSLFDEPLAAAGAVIYQRRVTYLEQLQRYFLSAFSFIGHVSHAGRICYRSHFVKQGDGSVKDALFQALETGRKRDIERGFTQAGPHADDIDCFFGEKPLSGYASQGQTRAFVLALKMAEIQHFYNTRGFAPVLLLDDVCSELDAIRSAQLFSFLREIPSQLFITATEAESIPTSLLGRVIRVHAGEASVSAEQKG